MVVSSKVVVAVAPDGLTATSGYEGVLREVACESDRAIQVWTCAQGGAATGWHHHGEREVFGYLVRGRARFEFGPGGRHSTEVETGGFFHVPAGIVHRDVNPTDEAQELALVFVGTGPLVVDVDGPATG
ncbi:MAG: cupin domain-containing protein [Gaiellaceae bacterium]